MENPGNQPGESVGLVEDPPPPTTATQDQSTSESYSQPQQRQPRPPPPLSPLTGCYLLVVVGEPHSERHKEIILQKIAKAFLSWDINECHVSLEKELQVITGQSPEGEEARFGERLIQYATENLVTEILIHPQLNTLHQCMKNLLSSFTKHRHIIHAGYTFAGNGSWILQDGTLSISDLVEALHEPEVLRVLKAYENSVSIDVHCAPEGDWTTERFQKEPVSKLCNIRINPGDVMTAGNSAISAFIDYLSPFLEPANIQHLLQPTDVVGNIRFTHPTLYVFPGGQGDAALFGINGFNMLIDGGFARKACFWDFARHLDRLDAVLLTRLNNSTVNGISAVLQRKKMNHVYPQIGHFFCNLQDRKIALSPDGDKDKDSLIVNLAEEGQEIVANLRHLALKPHPCYRDGNQVDPVNLYHKVGHGKLDMYVISPARDSQAVKEFLTKWSSNDSHLFSQTGKKISGKAFEFPLQNLVSICALLVWQPANPNDTITRILFPGSTPQHKIFEGLEKLRHLEFLKHPVCSAKSISPSASTAAINRSVSKTRQFKVIDNKQKETKVISKSQVKPVKTKTEKTPPKDVKSKLDTNKLADEKNELENIKESVKKIETAEEPLKKLDNRILSKDEQIENIKKEIQKIEQAENEDQRKKIVHKSKYDMRFVKSKVDSRAPSKSIDRKKVPEKKGEAETSPTGTPKKGIVNGIATKGEKPKIGARPAKAPSPVSTPAKSAKEANNRKVLEARVSSRSSIKPAIRKKEETPPPPASTAAKPERKPISRRPKASLSPVKSSVGKPKVEPESVTKRVKKQDIDSTVVKTVSQTISKELQKGSVTEKTEIEEKKDRVIEIKKLGAETENKETDEKAVKDELESAHVEESNKDEEEDEEEEGEEEEEEEYLIVTKEESTEESAKEDEIEEEAQTKDETEGEGEMKKLLREEEESEKKREAFEKMDKGDKEIEGNLLKSEEKDREDTTGEKEKPKGKKAESLEEKIPEERESELLKLMEVDEGIDLKEPASKEHKEGESLPEEKISNTLETSATTAPTLPEDERIEEAPEEAKEQPVELKEPVEEKYIQEETKEEKKDEEEKEPEQQKELPSAPDDEGFPVPIPIVQKKPRDVVKTPDEVADLPMHEEVDPRMYSSGEFTKDLQKKQDEKPDAKEKVEVDSGEINASEGGELKKTSAGETEQIKDSVTSKYLNIIDELEKTTTEIKDENLEGKETSRDVDEFEKPEEMKTDDRKPSLRTDGVDVELLALKNVESIEKATASDLPNESIPRDVVGEFPEIATPVAEEKLKEPFDPTTQDVEKQSSGKSTPADLDGEVPHLVEQQSSLSQPKESPGTSTPEQKDVALEVFREPTSQIVQENLEKSVPLEISKEDSGKSTPQGLVKEPSGKSTPDDDLIKGLSREPTPQDLATDGSGKSPAVDVTKDMPENLKEKRPIQPQEEPNKTALGVLDKKEIPEKPITDLSGKSTPVEFGKDDNGKISPKDLDKEISTKLEPAILSKDPSRMSTPVEQSKSASGKSTPQDLEKEISEEKDSRKPSVQDVELHISQENNLVFRAPTPQDLEKDVSGKSTPKEKIFEKLEEHVGRSFSKDLDEKEPMKDASGKSTPLEILKEDFEKSASTDLNKKTSETPPLETARSSPGNLSPREPEEKDSRKSSLSGATGRSTPLEVSRQSTPRESAKDVSGKSTPQDLREEVLETLGKNAPQLLGAETPRQSTPCDSIKDTSGKSTPQDVISEESKAPLHVSGKSTPQDITDGISGKSTPQKIRIDESGKSTPEGVEKEEEEDLGKETSAELQPENLNKEVSRTPTPEKVDEVTSGKSSPQNLEKQVSRQSTPQDLTVDVTEKSTFQDLKKDTLRASGTPEGSGKTTPNELELEKEVTKSPELKIVSGKSSPAESEKELSGSATPKGSTKETFPTPSPQKDTPEEHDLEKPTALQDRVPSPVEISKEVSRKSSSEDAQKEMPGSKEEPSSGKTSPEKIVSEKLIEAEKHGIDTSVKANSIDVEKSDEASPQREKDSSRRASRDASGKITPEGEEGNISRRESLVEGSNKSSPVPASQEGRTTPQGLPKDEILSKSPQTEGAENEKDKSGKTSPDVKSWKTTSPETVKEIEERTPEKGTKKVADSVSDSVSSGPAEKDLSGKSTPYSTDKEISGKASPQTGGRATFDSFSLALAEKGTSETYSLEKEGGEKLSSPSPVDISPLSLDELREDSKDKSNREKDVQGKRRTTEVQMTQLEKVKYDEASSGTSTPDRSHIEKSDTSLLNGVESEEECEKGILESERQEKESQILDISSGEEEELKALEEEDEDSEPETRKGDLDDGLTKEIAKDEKEDINKLVKAEAEEEQTDAKSGVKRMLVTASSEDGGTETEICIKSGIKIVKEEVDVEEGEKAEKADAEEEKEAEFSNLILQAREEYNAQRSRKTSYNGSEEAEEVEEKSEKEKDDVEEELSTLLMHARQELAYVRSKSREINESNLGRSYGRSKSTTTSETTRMDDDDLIVITTILTEEREEQEDGTVKITTTKETTTKGGKDEGTVVTIKTNVENKEERKDDEESSQPNSSGERRTKRGSKEEGERTSQEEAVETSRRTSASSIISQEDLVSRKDSAKLEDFRQSSTEMSPLKTTYITSHGDSESLMTSSFYGNLPTEDEMIGRAEHLRDFRKGKGYESFTEIGPNGERTERTYFYGREEDPRGARDNRSRFVKAYYTEDGQQRDEEQSRFVHKYYTSDVPEEEEIEKSHFVQRFYTEETSRPDSEGKFRFVETATEEPVESMGFAKAVDEHVSARGEYLGKEDLTKYVTEKSKQEEEEAAGSRTNTETSKSDVIGDWGKPLGLPLPPKNVNKNYGFPGQNISTTSSLSTPTDNSDSVNNWGQPMSLPSPAPPPTQNGTAETLIGKGVSAIKETPKKEKKIQPKKNISENNRSSGTNTPNRRSESPVKQTERRTPSTGRSNRSPSGYVYLDLTYVPHHGNSYYSNVEFFKKVRARYYVFSGTEPSKEVYNALLEAKQTWENKQLEVTIIPTYDTDVLGYWVAENEEILAKHKIDLSPSASRCTINLQDHETSCSAYRLEF